MADQKQVIQQLGGDLKELHQVLNEIDEKTARRDELKGSIMKTIKEHGLEDKRFDVGNRMIRYKVNNTTGSITNSYLLGALKEYFKEDPETASRVFQYIIASRPKKEVEALEILKKK